MATLTIRLFGRFELWCEDRPIRALSSRGAQELLSYLLLHAGQPQQREVLAGLLWEDATAAQARKYLRQALWQVQASLHLPGEPPDSHVLEVDSEWIQLNRCDRLRVDVAQFKDGVESCHGFVGTQLDGAAGKRLEDAVRLYRGELLAGWYQDWCLIERERLQNYLLDTLEKLISWCEVRRTFERGIEHALRALAVDPAREEVHRHIMRLHALAGHRTQAMRQYQSCERILMQELGVKPSASTRGLYEAIREDRFDAAAPAADALPASLLGLAHSDLPALLHTLQSVQAAFVSIESRLRHLIGDVGMGDSKPS